MVESPCNNECVLNDEDVCVSCYRELSEIISWSNLSDEEKKEILDKIRKRKSND